MTKRLSAAGVDDTKSSDPSVQTSDGTVETPRSNSSEGEERASVTGNWELKDVAMISFHKAA